MKIILASKSPRRKRILEENGYKIKVDVSNADETIVKIKDMRKRVINIAVLKAATVAKKYKNAIIIAADTLVYFEGKEIGQQKDDKSAYKVLKALNGKTHEVYTGICIMVLKNGIVTRMFKDSEVSEVKFKKVDDKVIREYVAGGHYKGKAGAYNVSNPEFNIFIDRIYGSYTNVEGLPIENINELFEKIKLGV